MRAFFQKLERRFGRYAIPRLTLVIIGCYVLGYMMEAINSNAAAYMNLNMAKVLQGQIWRLVTWIVIPPSSLDVFTIIMLFFYFSIGSTLERAWGDFCYNLYVLGGMLLSVIAALITYLAFGAATGAWERIGSIVGNSFTTYYITLSLLLAFAATFPDSPVYLMFVLKVPMKYLGYIDGAIIVYTIITNVRYALRGYFGNWIIVIAICASMLNFIIFFLLTRSGTTLNRRQRQVRRNFRKTQKIAASGRGTSSGRAAAGSAASNVVKLRTHRHRCTVCGRTEISDPDLEFRYCSKCSGAHEYCMEHLYTHVHITAQEEES
ncbi:MAG: hypothetical protein Q4B09_08210 [Lachnospiraceae bacterium]|nr:hypothetical protein [Lachnospiraceae bacterium]